MSIATRFTPVAAACCAVIIAACAGDKSAEDSTAAAPPAASPPAASTVSLADVAGTWSVRAVPESGSDTTTTTYTLKATADTTGWTMTFPGGSPLPLTVRVDGDSILAQAGPYDSVRRRGMKVTTNSVTRVNGNTLTGTSVARYQTTGADSVLRLRLTGTRTP